MASVSFNATGFDIVTQGIPKGGVIPGISVGPWKIHKEIGSGTFSIVFRATDDKNNDLAVKFMKLTSPEEYELALKEVSEMRSWDHPNIVRMVGNTLVNVSCEDLKITYLAVPLELLSPIRLLPTESMTESELLGILRDIGSALLYLHGRSCIHGNVKDSNVLRRGFGSQAQFVLTDRGMAMALSRAASGSTPHSAPEVKRMEQITLCTASDVWSLGCVMMSLAHCLPTQLPYLGCSDSDLQPTIPKTKKQAKQARKHPKKPEQLAPDFPWQIAADYRRAVLARIPASMPKLTSVLSKMLEADVNSRPTATELLSLL